MPDITQKLLWLLLLLMLKNPLFSQSLSCEDGITHWETDIRVGLNNDGFQFGAGIAYFPIQYIGIKTQLGFNGEIEEFHADPMTKSSYTTRFLFTPAIILRTPRVIHLKNQDSSFYLFTEPGITLSPGASGSKNAKTFNWDLKAGINLQIDRYIFTIGYGITDFSLYSGNPVNHWGLPDVDNYITHSGFVGIAYKF